MALVLKDRVQETTTTTGTGTLTLGGAVTGYQSFSAIGNANTTYYAIYASGGSEWEVGIGTYTASGTTLSRDTVLSSSNSGSLVSFSAGTKNVWCDYPAGRAGYVDTNSTLNAPVLATSSVTSTTPVLGYNASNTDLALGATVSGSYLQAVMQNKSGTAGASTNFAVSNDLGTDSTYYGEFGMNSSVFSSGTPADFFSLNNGIYYSGHDGDITIGSGNGKKTFLAWGTTGQSAHVINATGSIGLNTDITGATNYGTSGQVLTSGGSAATPTWTTPTTGTVTSVTGTSPVVSSGGNTPAISMPAATTSVSGYLTSTDWNTFNGKGSGSVTSVAATVPSFLSVSGSPITSSGTLALTYSGTALPVANGGTGLTATPTNGQIDIGNGTGFTRSAITGTTSQVSVTNGAGSITLSLPSTINVNTSGNAATATSATTATNLASGANLQIPYQTASGTTSFVAAPTLSSTYLQYNGTGFTWAASAGVGTVTSVAQSFTGGLISVSGSPITTTGTLALTVAGTSGGIPYFSSSSAWASSAALTQYGVVYGGGAGNAPVSTAAGTTGQVLTATTSGAPTWATPTSTPAGSNTQVQYNNSGAFAGSSSFTFDGTNLTTGGLNTPNTFAFKNRLIDAGFIINQRGYTSGTSLSSGSYGHDRWKGGGSGGTYTFTQGSAGVPIVITITAGTIQQVIEGSNVAEGGTYTLSWTGTATARINSGSYTSSPITVTSQTAGSNMTIEFGTGTVSYPQLETGNKATSFDYRSFGTELNLCQRYYQIIQEGAGFFSHGAAISGGQVRGPRFGFLQTMRTNPTVTLPTAGTGTNQMYYCTSGGGAASIGSFSAQQIKQDSFFMECEGFNGLSAGDTSLLASGTGGITITLAAEL